MLYNKENLPKVASTAGRITILTALVCVVVFATALVFDFGAKELSKVSAQTATTTLTVLNTPPAFDIFPYETTESSTSTPTNSGDTVVWGATATDANGADWYLLVCSNNATPTANNSAAPNCHATAQQWAVSGAVTSGSGTTVSTTTTEAAPFSEREQWYAWACDGDADDARCSVIPWNGDGSATSSPFHVNSRPVFDDHLNNGPIDPGAVVVFNSTSSDPDNIGGEDAIFLVVCGDTSYNTTTNTCDTNFIASTTATELDDAAATFTVAAIRRDQTYVANGYIVDEHGHEALGNTINADFTVANVAPIVLSADIIFNGVSNLNPSVPEGETTGFTLDFTVRDANSCDAVGGGLGDEVVSYYISVFRSGIGTSSCNSVGLDYDPNNCYTNGVAAATWNLQCTASTTSCTGDTDDTQIFECTFPLWFVADPTDFGPFAAENWSAAVSGIDDDGASSTLATTTNSKELIAFTAIDLLTAQIPYGSLQPGDDSGTLSASTTVESVGNTSLDHQATGDSMCGTYTPSTPCPGSGTSTIPENQQQFSSTSLDYNDVQATILSSTTANEVELDVPKSTSTSTPASGVTWWGIAVPASISLAGSYEGLNTFYAVTDELYE